MPFSVNALNNVCAEHILKIKPLSVLDIGPGEGKYGKLVKSIYPDTVIDGVEPEWEWVGKFSLIKTYNELIHSTAEEFFKQDLTHKYDLIIMGDVIEHMFLNDAIGVVDAACYKGKHIMLIWPTNLPQDEEHGRTLEMHKSNIFISDLSRFNVLHYTKLFMGYNSGGVPWYMNYCLIGGHTLAPQNYALKEFL